MRMRQFLSTGLTVALVGLGSVTLPPVEKSHALCVNPTPDFTGSWRNVDPNTRGVTRVEISYACSDVRVCDAQTGTCSTGPSGYFIHVYGSCYPTDCDWSEVQATTYPIITTSNFPISFRVTTGLRAFYNQGFAQRNLSAIILESGSRRGQLKLTVNTVYTDSSGRPNRSDIYYFTRG